MGWSVATREGKTAVALLSLTGGDLLCESGGTCMEAAKVEGKCWRTIPGTTVSHWAAR